MRWRETGEGVGGGAVLVRWSEKNGGYNDEAWWENDTNN